METPKFVKEHTKRQHTPRLSERKKKLFTTQSNEKSPPDNGDLLKGIQPIKQFPNKTPTKKAQNEINLENILSTKRGISFFKNDLEGINNVEDINGKFIDTSERDSVVNMTPARRSRRLRSRQQQQEHDAANNQINQKESRYKPIKTPKTGEDDQQQQQQLQKLFNKSMRLSSSSMEKDNDENDFTLNETILEIQDEEEKENQNVSHVQTRSAKKRHQSDNVCDSPKRKQLKEELTPPQMQAKSIPTKSFYPASSSTTTPISKGKADHGNNWHNTQLLRTPIGTRSSERLKKSKQIARHSLSGGARRRSSVIRRGITKVKNHTHSLELEDLLDNIRNEKLRHLIISKRDTKQQVEKLHQIMREARNPIAMARPLSSLSNHNANDDSNNNYHNKNKNNNKDNINSNDIKLDAKQNSVIFSDISDMEDDAENEELATSTTAAADDSAISLMTCNADEMKENDEENFSVHTKRKFFKSGYTSKIRKQVQITDNIKATIMGDGKLCMVPEVKKKQKKRRIKSTKDLRNEFSNEQATVDAILRKLDDSIYGENINNHGLQKTQDQQKLRQQQHELHPSTHNTINAHDHNASDSIRNQQQQQMEEVAKEIQYQQIEELGQQQDQQNEEDSVEQSHFVEILSNMPEYKKFYERLPYNTNDPEIIERQYILLEFLITNNICTEENFTIFIADPDNHKDEAEQIVNELVMIIGDDDDDDNNEEMKIDVNGINKEVNIKQNYKQLEQQQPAQQHEIDKEEQQEFISNECNQMDVVIGYDSTNIVEQQEEEQEQQEQQAITVMDVTIESEIDISINTLIDNVATETQESPSEAEQQQEPKKLFPIFLKNAGYKPLSLYSTNRRTTKAQRCWNGGYGLNQYQIDAGQKQFGATQCKQCGLLYTMHEPEEEKLHREFHNSIHLLRFRGWSDEDVVATYPEWSVDGRIIRITDNASTKRRQRVMDVLNVVDKELGYASYIMPQSFVAYFAIRKSQIAGLCLVQPLEKANKYVCVDGVDCCTQEEFNVRCGISRLWVAPLHRRLHIASKLLRAVQMNTILGQELPWDQIAFSAPTEMGKIFAQKVTKMENFLVYS